MPDRRDAGIIDVEYNPSSQIYTIHRKATLHSISVDFQISEMELMKKIAQPSEDKWDAVQLLIDEHLFKPRRREAIEHTKRKYANG